MTFDFAHTFQLVHAALSLPATVDELKSPRGNRIRVARSPANGIAVRLTEYDSANEPVSTILRVRATDMAPAGYPDAVPFVPETIATIVETTDEVAAIWLDPDRLWWTDRRGRSADPLTVYREVRNQAKQVGMEEDDEGSASIGRWRALNGLLPEDARQEPESATAAVKAVNTILHLEAIAQEVGYSSLRAGWVLAASLGQTLEPAIQFACYTRGDRQRHVMLLAPRVSNVVMLIEPGSSLAAGA
ncbi:MAG: hypothetical protein GTN62_11595 [Gemmatimonadales bacterium]|nr:hypothetical protein [Gemmatimonadales bacterium]NIN12275.1 hypothetical protein [Gemmatimonadales bacterium]NIN50738.1 hypothetical protein [Gemmatimonadales bacterium]NIP08202.1 hypothetical protein [Gemmatimonadales bacterium]NIR03480.1 hypothetical protein [Gemmatimonadales bacterium]